MADFVATDRAAPVVRRVDAELNRARILSAARDAFARPGVEVSMAEVSRRAGVGMATLYRNFQGRRELLEALYTEEVDDICAAATKGGGSSSVRLRGWLEELFAFFASKRHIAAELLKHTDSADPVVGGSRARVLSAGRPLLQSAQDAGDIRADLAIEQVLDLVHAVATINGDSAYVLPLLRSALDGLQVPR